MKVRDLKREKALVDCYRACDEIVASHVLRGDRRMASVASECVQAISQLIGELDSEENLVES